MVCKLYLNKAALKKKSMEYYSVQKRCARSSCEKTQGSLKRILLSERPQSERATSFKIPTIRHSGKGNVTETVKKIRGCQGWDGGEG